MIQPTGKLPFKEKLVRNDYKIIDSKNNVIASNIRSLADAMYIEESCNHYQKVIELLNSFIHSVEHEGVGHGRVAQCLKESKLFIKQLDDL